MAKKSKPKKPTSSKKSSTGGSLGKTAVGLGKQALGLGGKSGKGGKRRKKSALFYAKEIQRLKLKRRYEKVRMGV